MTEDKTYTKEEVELRERVVKLEEKISHLESKQTRIETAVNCHTHKNSERPLFDYA